MLRSVPTDPRISFVAAWRTDPAVAMSTAVGRKKAGLGQGGLSLALGLDASDSLSEGSLNPAPKLVLVAIITDAELRRRWR